MTFRVDEAASGEEALAAVADAERDVGSVRDRVPRLADAGLDGIETARRIDAMPLGTRPRRVLVTAYGREDVFREADDAGFDGILVKPVSPSTALRRRDAGPGWRGRPRVRARRPMPIPRPRRATSPGCRARASCSSRTTSSISRWRSSCSARRASTSTLAENGALGVQRVQEGSYDLVLMDLQMPVMDGLEATRRIRAMPGRDRLPILAMTANAMAGDRERSLAAGMNDHVTKPIDPDELFDVLLRWLPDRRGRRAAAGDDRSSPRRPPLPRAPIWLDLIPGLDTADGMRRVLGRREAYAGPVATLCGRSGRCHARHSHGARGWAVAMRPNARRTRSRVSREPSAPGNSSARPAKWRPLSAVAPPRSDVEPLIWIRPSATLDHLITALLGALPAESPGRAGAVERRPSALAASRRGTRGAAVERRRRSRSTRSRRRNQSSRRRSASVRSEIGTLVRGYRFEDALAALREQGRVANAPGETDPSATRRSRCRPTASPPGVGSHRRQQ